MTFVLCATVVGLLRIEETLFQDRGTTHESGTSVGTATTILLHLDPEPPSHTESFPLAPGVSGHIAR